MTVKTENGTLLELTQTAFAVTKYANSRLYKEAGSSWKTTLVLQTLVSHGGEMTPGRMAELTLRARHDMTTQMQRMKRHGLITVEPNPGDRRSFIMKITPAGRETLKASETIIGDITGQMITSLTLKQVAALKEILDTIKSNQLLSWQALQLLATRK